MFNVECTYYFYYFETQDYIHFLFKPQGVQALFIILLFDLSLVKLFYLKIICHQECQF